MKFSQMPYARPDTNAFKKDIVDHIERFKAAQSFEAAEEVFLSIEKVSGKYSTAATLAHIRHDINTCDEFYNDEKAFFDSISPELAEYFQMWTLALLESPFRARFEEKYGKLMFVNAEMALKTFSPEIIPDLQRENVLTTEYMKLTASGQIPFEGGIYTSSQMGPFKLDPNDDRRLSAWKADGEFYKSIQPKLDEIYDELVKVRDGMGRKLGFDGYTQLGYYRMTRNCYDKNDIEKFRAAVRKYLVPVADRIYRKQAERLGKSYPMIYADNALEFRSGNPKPIGTPAEILEHGRKFYHELSPETAEFIDVMLDNELLDVESRTGKSNGGYCTTIDEYKVPFIFANFNGTSGDVEVITHEAGHAFAFYTARNLVPTDNQHTTAEAAEVHSMSMEFFAWPWAEGFFGEDTKKFYYTHLSGALTFIPYGTMVDHFQHIVYERPEMTPEERHAVWAELTAEYMPWVKLDGTIPFYGEGQAWQRQLHIYQYPFYYIDYCLAQTVALQFWAEIQADRDEAWKKYMAYTLPAGTKTFRDLVEGAGLDTPFGDDALKTVCEVASKWLDEYDLGDIK